MWGSPCWNFGTPSSSSSLSSPPASAPMGAENPSMLIFRACMFSTLLRLRRPVVDAVPLRIFSSLNSCQRSIWTANDIEKARRRQRGVIVKSAEQRRSIELGATTRDPRPVGWLRRLSLSSRKGLQPNAGPTQSRTRVAPARA